MRSDVVRLSTGPTYIFKGVEPEAGRQGRLVLYGFFASSAAVESKGKKKKKLDHWSQHQSRVELRLHTDLSAGRRSASSRIFLIIMPTLNRAVPLFFVIIFFSLYPKTVSPFRLVNAAANTPFEFVLFSTLYTSVSFSTKRRNPTDVPFSHSSSF